LNDKWQRLKAYALSRGSSNFASHVIELFISGKRNSKTSYKYLYADFIRQEVRELRTPDPTEILSTQEPTRLPRGLTTQERVVFVLYCSWGFTYKEIAHCLGVSESRISKILARSFEQ
jgi:DNA-directed RNA polymerase specialized sigma24 family protein